MLAYARDTVGRFGRAVGREPANGKAVHDGVRGHGEVVRGREERPATFERIRARILGADGRETTSDRAGSHERKTFQEMKGGFKAASGAKG